MVACAGCGEIQRLEICERCQKDCETPPRFLRSMKLPSTSHLSPERKQWLLDQKYALGKSI